MSDERCPTCGQRVQVETTGEDTSRFVPVAVEDGGYWEDRATAAEARPRSRLAEVEQERDALFEANQALAADHYFRRAERAEAERDRAIETRENANAVSVRVEIENRQLRERAERAEAALREIGPELANFASYARSVADDSMGMRRKMWQERAAWGECLTALASVPSPLDAPKEQNDA